MEKHLKARTKWGSMRGKRGRKKIHPLPPQPQNCSWQPGPGKSLEAGKGQSTRMTEISPNLLCLAELINRNVFFCAYYWKYWGSSLKTEGVLFYSPHPSKKKVLKGKRMEKQMEKMNPISALWMVSKLFPLEKNWKGTFYWKEISWDSRHRHELRCWSIFLKHYFIIPWIFPVFSSIKMPFRLFSGWAFGFFLLKRQNSSFPLNICTLPPSDLQPKSVICKGDILLSSRIQGQIHSFG